MKYKVKLKNSDDVVLLDANTYEWLVNDRYYTSIKLLDNLRLHSSGCVVFQKVWKKAESEGGGYKTQTIYLHVLIAQKFLSDQKSVEKKLVGAKNGDKLDCRVENLEYRSRSVASRKRKTSSNTGFTGVYREHNRFRAVISIGGRAKHIGMFDTAEEAAIAYNKVSKEHFGADGKINKVGKWK